MELGIQLFGCMKEYTRDPEALLFRLAEAGYTEAEPCVWFGGEEIPIAWSAAALPEHIGRLKNAGLALRSCHLFAPSMTDAAEDACRAAQRFGIRAYVVGLHGETFDQETLSRFVEETGALARRLEKEGTQLWLHNNAAEIRAQVDGVSAYEWVLRELDGLLGAQVDTGWVVYGGAELSGFLARNAAFVRSIHHKDIRLTKTDKGAAPVNVPLGQGDVDCACAFAFAKAHSLGQIVDQDTSERELLEDLRESAAYLSTL